MDWLSEEGEDGANKIAPYLPKPFLTAEGEPKIPELTNEVIGLYGNNEEFTNNFSEPPPSRFGLVSDHVKKAEELINVAVSFTSHKSVTIKSWALNTIRHCENERDLWQRRLDEDI